MVSVLSVVIKVLFEFILFCIKCIIGNGCCKLFLIFVMIWFCVLVGLKVKFVKNCCLSWLWGFKGIVFMVCFFWCNFKRFKFCVSNFLNINCCWVGCIFCLRVVKLILFCGWCKVINVLVKFILVGWNCFGSNFFIGYFDNSVSVWLLSVWIDNCFSFLVIG